MSFPRPPPNPGSGQPPAAPGGFPLGIGERSPGCGQPLKAATARDVNTTRARTAAQFLAFTGHGLKKKINPAEIFPPDGICG